MKLNAKWTDDCQGKKDYDANLVRLSTRYWPRGGGFHILDTARPDLGFQGNATRPEIKPSAHASILLLAESEDADNHVFAECSFEAETEEEVKAQVEQWAQAQFDRIVSALGAVFAPTPAPGGEG